MQFFDDGSVAYLESKDYTRGGKLALPKKMTRGRPIVVLLQGNHCPFCTDVKPEFARFAQEHRDLAFPATVQVDGGRSEQALWKRLQKNIKKIQGIPMLLLFDSDGNLVKVGDGRSKNAIVEFVKENS